MNYGGQISTSMHYSLISATLLHFRTLVEYISVVLKPEATLKFNLGKVIIISS